MGGDGWSCVVTSPRALPGISGGLGKAEGFSLKPVPGWDLAGPGWGQPPAATPQLLMNGQSGVRVASHHASLLALGKASESLPPHTRAVLMENHISHLG